MHIVTTELYYDASIFATPNFNEEFCIFLSLFFALRQRDNNKLQ